MKRMSKIIGLALATSAVSLFLSGCGSFCSTEEPTVKCGGLNTCGAYQYSTPDRGNKNSGWVYMTKSECMSAGGYVVD